MVLRNQLTLVLALPLALFGLALGPPTTVATEVNTGVYSADSYEDAANWLATNCDPAYAPDWIPNAQGQGLLFCVPVSSTDLDCQSINYVNIVVVGVDWMHLDEDGDGIGCELDPAYMEPPEDSFEDERDPPYSPDYPDEADNDCPQICR